MISLLMLIFHVLSSLALFRVVSAVLQFGNMVFKQERSSEQAIMPSNEGQFFFVAFNSGSVQFHTRFMNFLCLKC